MFLADGFEDIEALAVRDILERGGVEVTLVSVNGEQTVLSSHNLKVIADVGIEELQAENRTTDKDFLIFPGGMPGSKSLGECDTLVRMMNAHYKSGGSLAAICAAPGFVLSKLEEGRIEEFCCYDGCGDKLLAKGARFLRKPYVVSGRIVTGRGPLHAIDFGFAVLSLIKGEAIASGVRAAMSLPCDD